MPVYFYNANQDSKHSEFHSEFHSEHEYDLSRKFDAGSLAEAIAEHCLNRSADTDSFPMDIEIYKTREDAEQENPVFSFKVGVSFHPVFDAQEV